MNPHHHSNRPMAILASGLTHLHTTNPSVGPLCLVLCSLLPALPSHALEVHKHYITLNYGTYQLPTRYCNDAVRNYSMSASATSCKASSAGVSLGMGHEFTNRVTIEYSILKASGFKGTLSDQPTHNPGSISTKLSQAKVSVGSRYAIIDDLYIYAKNRPSIGSHQ